MLIERNYVYNKPLFPFRARATEWCLSFALIVWGIIALSVPGLFHIDPYYSSLLTLATQSFMGISATVLGLIRVVFLIINGAWRPSAHIRSVGCILGTMVWGSLAIYPAIIADYFSPTSGIYVMLCLMDLLSLWFASEDAKLADIAAKRNKG